MICFEVSVNGRMLCTAWLADQIGPELLDATVIPTGPQAHRRNGGIAVVPAALLGPANEPRYELLS
jgi:hypothetical protein